MQKYFMMIGGVRFGPLTAEEMLQKGLNRDSLVWKDGMADYVPAHQVPELATMAGGLPPPTPTVAPPPAPPRPAEPPKTPTQSSSPLSRPAPTGKGDRCWNCGGEMKRYVLFGTGALGTMEALLDILMVVGTLGLWLIPKYATPKKCVRCRKSQHDEGGCFKVALGIGGILVPILVICAVPKLLPVAMLIVLAVGGFILLAKLLRGAAKVGEDDR